MNSSEKRDTILYVGNIPKFARETLRQHNPDWQVYFLKDVYKKKPTDAEIDVDEILYVDFKKSHKIAATLLPFSGRILAVTTHGDLGVRYLRSVLPYLPYLRTPTTESLVWATNKLKMRQRFALFCKENTPDFTRVRDQSEKERLRIIEKVGFPMVIKPADLASSLLVSICYHEEELEKVLRQTFLKIRKQYKANQRSQDPLILAESFIEGDMYSVDVYVDSRGHVTCCPLVKVLRGSDIGDDDFYNYAHLTPSGLRTATEKKAYEVAKQAVHALSLRSVTAHVELLKVDDEWKIIEVGPRMGGFRHVIYDLAYGINHTLNDVLVRIPKRPDVSKQKHSHAVTLKWFADKEGEITEMKGIKKVESLESFHEMSVNKSIGDRVRFSKNGGKSVFHIFLTNKDRSRLLADIRRVEKLIEIKTK